MKRVGEIARRIAMLLRGERFDRDLRDEMQLHIDLRRAERVAAGMPPREADSAARREFGNPAALCELSGDEWGWRAIENFTKDVRFGARTLRRSPGFTAVAVIALALGIGANTAIFSVVNAILLRPLAYRDAGRLVTILHGASDPVAPANYADWREQTRSFETMAAAEVWSPNLTGSDPPENLKALRLTPNLLPMLGVRPALGRWFAAGEDVKGSDHKVILSDRLWRRRFSGEPGVLGRNIVLDGEAWTVIGVMPPEFRFAPFWATRTELWVPLSFGANIYDRGGNSLRVFARLKPGVTLEQARADVAGITGRLEREFPGSNRNVLVTPLKENVVGKVEKPLLLIMGAVGFVLLIACANVAHMLLARTSDRQREIAVRTALGAGRKRVIAQFLTESLMLSGAGAAAGWGLAVLGTKALVALSPPYLPRIETVGIDFRVALFLLTATVLTALLFGLAPALSAAARDVSGSLKDGGRQGSDGIERGRLRSFLVASEFALAFILLIGAGLTIRSFDALQAVDPGFNPHNVLSMIVSVAGSQESEPLRRELFYRQLLDRVRALPGVASAGAINHLPLAGDMWGKSFRIEGRPEPKPGESPAGVYRVVMPGYFETMGLPLRQGRVIGPGDDSRAPAAVVINERAAREYWPGENPIGKRINFSPTKWITVVGVVANAKQIDWAAPVPYPELYLSGLQDRQFLGYSGSHTSLITLVVRTTGNAADLAPAIKQAVWSLDRNLPISEVLTMENVVADANAQPRFEMLLLAVFGAVALALAATGIYGVMNYAVSRRTREIGIRISLGASRAEVLRMVLRTGIAQALAGTAVGIAGAVPMARLMEGMLYGVRPTDPATFFAVVAVLTFVAALATVVPAGKAMRVEPVSALRHE